MWHSHSMRGRLAYERFLGHVRWRFKVSINDVLDLACGAGTLTARLAHECRRVVALDCNRYMLAEAKKNCNAYSNVHLVEADFRSFAIGETFDAAICASDSINYLDDIAELRDVFRSVAAHLRLGGFFLFDALGEVPMRAAVRYDTHYPRHSMCYYFDPSTRKSRTLVVFRDAVEEHVRIPIDPPDVVVAADDAGLVVLEAFPHVSQTRKFYLLRKPVTMSSASQLRGCMSQCPTSLGNPGNSDGMGPQGC